MKLAMLFLVAASSLAHADPDADLVERFANLTSAMPGVHDAKPSRLAITGGIHVFDEDALSNPWGDYTGHHPNAVVAKAADGKSTWVAVDLEFRNICGMDQCMHDPPAAIAHAVGLFEGPQPIMWALARIPKAKELAAAKGKPLAAMPNQVDAGTAEVVKMVTAALADPAALGKAISDRKDVVLYGSELAERYVGGATVRATLAKWKLAFKIHDGVQAGLTSSKTVAFVAANVDAGKTPYQLVAICEKSGSDWKIVQLSFGAGL